MLPITVDDLTSGFNVGKILTLSPKFASMLGFTHSEARTYLDIVFKSSNFDEGMKEEIWQLLINNYNGYHFLPQSEPYLTQRY